MIAVTRGEKPLSLKRYGEVWTLELCKLRRQYYRDLEEFRNGHRNTLPERSDAIKTRYATDSIKRALKSMFGFKCAYCEGSITATSYLHVEHFRPQSIYPAYAYEWDNLLYSCAQCNSMKRGRFPVGPTGEDAVENIGNPCDVRENEDVLLVNPCNDNPNDFFEFVFTRNAANKIVDVTLVCKNRRAKITRDICGLNREELSDLRRAHMANIDTHIVTYRLAQQLPNEALLLIYAEKLRNHVSANAPYSAMARALIVDECGIDVEALPR